MSSPTSTTPRLRRLTSPLPSPLATSPMDNDESTSAPHTPLGMRTARDRRWDDDAGEGPCTARDESRETQRAGEDGRVVERQASREELDRLGDDHLDLAPAHSHSPSPTRSDHPSLAHSSPDQTPESSRGSVSQRASSFDLGASSPSHLPASRLDFPAGSQPALNPLRFSSFSSGSSLTSGTTSDSDNPFLYQPPALPIPPPRPDRPTYGAGTLPVAIPTPLVQSASAPSDQAERFFEHPLRGNPSSVPTSEYTFPPVPMRGGSPPRAEEPDDSDLDFEELDRKRRSQTTSSDEDEYGSATDSGHSSQSAAFAPLPTSSPPLDEEPPTPRQPGIRPSQIRDHAFEAYAYSRTPVLFSPAASPQLSNLSRTRAVPSPSSLPAFPSNRRPSNSSDHRSTNSDILELYENLPSLSRQPKPWSAGLEGGLGNGFEGGPGIGMTRPRRTASLLPPTPPIDPDAEFQSEESPSEELMVPLASLTALRTRALDLQSQLSSVTTALRIARASHTPDDFLGPLGIDPEITTPIFLSPSVVALDRCTHCGNRVPRRVGGGTEYLDQWRTEHWACIPFLTTVVTFAQE